MQKKIPHNLLYSIPPNPQTRILPVFFKCELLSNAKFRSVPRNYYKVISWPPFCTHLFMYKYSETLLQSYQFL
jgi:hypothetical protein